MSRRSLVVVAVNAGQDYVLTGWKADEVIEAAGYGAVWSRLYDGWLLYPEQVPDVVAAAQYRSISISGELPPIQKRVPVVAADSRPVGPQLDLFCGDVA